MVEGNLPVVKITSLSEDDYYTELVTRNRGVISDAQQEALRTATVLIAGCGSVGGAAVQPLARMGVRRFLVADSWLYELNNLNRQHATVDDIDRNKAEVAAERILAVNPYAQVKVYAEGVTEGNAAELAAACQVIVDGVDVTTMSGLRLLPLRRIPSDMLAEGGFRGSSLHCWLFARFLGSL
jgi:molybdopterin/thiamine biosynthesis adenylyltransferase